MAAYEMTKEEQAANLMDKFTVTIHSLLGCDSNGFCHYKSPSAMGKTHLKP